MLPVKLPLAILAYPVQNGIVAGKGKSVVQLDMFGELPHLFAVEMNHFAAYGAFQMKMVMASLFTGQLITRLGVSRPRKLEQRPFLHHTLYIPVDGGKVYAGQRTVEFLHRHGTRAVLKEPGDPATRFRLVFAFRHASTVPRFPPPVLPSCPFFFTLYGMNVLFLGEIVGKPGIFTVKHLKELREKKAIDLVIANGEGTTNGFGLGKAHSMQLSKLGVDILTGGEKIYYKLDMVDFLPKAPWILRPANYPMGNPGRGVRTLEVGGKTVMIINLLGTSGFTKVHLNNPFALAKLLVDKAHAEMQDPIILVQFHAATTAEKQTMGYLLDGKVAAVIGTHTKVLSADAHLLPGGTAYMTDNGRCGSTCSVGGFATDVELRKYLTGIPERSHENWDSLELQGALVSVDNGKPASIETIRYPVTKAEEEK